MSTVGVLVGQSNTQTKSIDQYSKQNRLKTVTTSVTRRVLVFFFKISNPRLFKINKIV